MNNTKDNSNRFESLAGFVNRMNQERKELLIRLEDKEEVGRPAKVCSRIGGALVIASIIAGAGYGITIACLSFYTVVTADIALILNGLYLIMWAVLLSGMVKIAPAVPGEQHKITSSEIIVCFFIICGFIYIGESLYQAVDILSNTFSSKESMILDVGGKYSLFIGLLYVCIIVPVLEGITYRKLILDRLRCVGTKKAIIVSAACYALSCGNLRQLIGMFFCGLCLSYIAAKSGRVRESICLHALCNLALTLANRAPADVKTWIVGLSFVGTAAAIIFILIKNRKAILNAHPETEAGTSVSVKTICDNSGAKLFLVFYGLNVVASIILYLYL